MLTFSLHIKRVVFLYFVFQTAISRSCILLTSSMKGSPPKCHLNNAASLIDLAFQLNLVSITT